MVVGESDNLGAEAVRSSTDNVEWTSERRRHFRCDGPRDSEWASGSAWALRECAGTLEQWSALDRPYGQQVGGQRPRRGDAQRSALASDSGSILGSPRGGDKQRSDESWLPGHRGRQNRSQHFHQPRLGWPDDPRNHAQRSALDSASLSGRVFKPFDVGKYLIQQLKE